MGVEGANNSGWGVGGCNAAVEAGVGAARGRVRMGAARGRVRMWGVAKWLGAVGAVVVVGGVARTQTDRARNGCGGVRRCVWWVGGGWGVGGRGGGGRERARVKARGYLQHAVHVLMTLAHTSQAVVQAALGQLPGLEGWRVGGLEG